MIAKALIEEKINNKFKVRIPLFESAGSSDQCILLATLCYVPGNLDCYNIGDVVFVAFENNQISSPVIIGKLYTGTEKMNTRLDKSSVLKVDTEANLPNQTRIGQFSPEEVFSTFKNSSIHETRIKDLEDKMNILINVVSEDNASLSDLIDFGQSSDEDINDLFEEDPEEVLNQTGYGFSSNYDVEHLYSDEANIELDNSDLVSAVQGTDYGLVDENDITNLFDNYDVEEEIEGTDPSGNLNSTNYDSTSNTDIAKLYEDTSTENLDNSDLVTAVQGTDYGLVTNEDIEEMYNEHKK